MRTVKPLVTVGIPIYFNSEIPWYNCSEALRNTLNSITKQTYNNLEIIISDNHSVGDEIKDIAKEFMVKDKRIKYFKQRKNIGGRKNYDFLLKKSKAKYFMWAPADDQWDRTYIEKCMNKFLQDDSIGLVFSKCEIASISNKKFNTFNSKINFCDFTHLNNSEIISLFILMSNSFHLETMIYGIWKRKLLIEAFEINFHLIEKYSHINFNGRPPPTDPAWIVYILINIKIYQIPEKLYVRRYRFVVPHSKRSKIHGIKTKIRKFHNLSYYKEVYDFNIVSNKMIEDILDIFAVQDKKIRNMLYFQKILFLLPVEIRNPFILLLASSILTKEKLIN